MASCELSHPHYQRQQQTTACQCVDVDFVCLVVQGVPLSLSLSAGVGLHTNHVTFETTPNRAQDCTRTREKDCIGMEKNLDCYTLEGYACPSISTFSLLSGSPRVPDPLFINNVR